MQQNHLHALPAVLGTKQQVQQAASSSAATTEEAVFAGRLSTRQGSFEQETGVMCLHCTLKI